MHFSINDIHAIFLLKYIPCTYSFQSTNFFLGCFPLFICKWAIPSLMPIGIILFARFGLSFQEKRVNCSQNDLIKQTIVSTINGSKGDEFGERSCKKVFNCGMVFEMEWLFSFQIDGSIVYSLVMQQKLESPFVQRYRWLCSFTKTTRLKFPLCFAFA